AVGTKDLVLTMEAGFTITGWIFDPDGKPVAQLQIQANPVDAQGGRVSGTQAMTDQDGRFTLAGLGPGDYRIEVPPWGGSNQAWVLDSKTTYPAGTADLRLTVTKGVTISGVMVDDTGAPLNQSWVMATSKKGAQKYGQSRGDGTFEIPALETGE